MSMQPYTNEVEKLRNRVPRRHSVDNVRDINGIIDDYEELLKKIEAIDAGYEKSTAIFFDELDSIRAKIKMSTSNKASKKNKDQFFDEASGSLKDNLQALLEVLG